MNQRTFFIFLLLFYAQYALGQTTYAVNDSVYTKAVEKALLSLNNGDCETCLSHYNRAFIISQKSATSLLRAATCAYQCGKISQSNELIKRATVTDWWVCEYVWKNANEYPELSTLRRSNLSYIFQYNLDEQKTLSGRNIPLESELESIFNADSKTRLGLDSVGRKYSSNSHEIKSILKQMALIDSINIVKIEIIINKYGYPGVKLVGEKQSSTAWLVIQHSPLLVQEKYLPIIKKAVEEKQLQKSAFALLVDRILVTKGEKQLYGSQIRNDVDGKTKDFYPIINEASVNKRRADVGLPPIEEYAKKWGINYGLLKK